MSQSKALGGGKVKAGAKTSTGKKPDAKKKAVQAVETLRIIEAPQHSLEPGVPLTAAERELSARVTALAAEVEQALKISDRTPVLHPAAVQAMLAALCRVYSMQIENGENYDAFSHANPVTPTDVMVTASGLLKAANLAVFELGMWQSWTGR